MRYWSQKTQKEIRDALASAREEWVRNNVGGAKQDQRHVLSMDEEMIIRSFSRWRCWTICLALNLSQGCTCHALTYLARTYLHASVMEVSPGVQTVVGACVFLAAKVCGEEHHRMPTEICKLINSKHVSEAGMGAAETTILRRIRFHLVCYNPFRVLEGMYMRGKPSLMQFPKRNLLKPPSLYAPSAESRWLVAVQQRVHNFVFLSYLDDLCVFCFTPAEIALAALVQCFRPVNSSMVADSVRGSRDAGVLDAFIRTEQRTIQPALRSFVEWFHDELAIMEVGTRTPGVQRDESEREVFMKETHERLALIGNMLGQASQLTSQSAKVLSALTKLKRCQKLSRTSP